MTLGRYSFRHLKADLLFGYRLVDLGDEQQAFVATPEKALLDAVYLQPSGDNPTYLQELRLSYGVLCMDTVAALATASRSPKLKRAVQHIRALAVQEPEYEAI